MQLELIFGNERRVLPSVRAFLHETPRQLPLETPVADPAVPHVVDELEQDGFGFIGVALHFSAQGDLLRLAYLVEPLSRQPIKTCDEFAGRLVDYGLAEQARVQNAI